MRVTDWISRLKIKPFMTRTELKGIMEASSYVTGARRSEAVRQLKSEELKFLTSQHKKLLQHGILASAQEYKNCVQLREVAQDVFANYRAHTSQVTKVLQPRIEEAVEARRALLLEAINKKRDELVATNTRLTEQRVSGREELEVLGRLLAQEQNELDKLKKEFLQWSESPALTNIKMVDLATDLVKLLGSKTSTAQITEFITNSFTGVQESHARFLAGENDYVRKIENLKTNLETKKKTYEQVIREMEQESGKHSEDLRKLGKDLQNPRAAVIGTLEHQFAVDNVPVKHIVSDAITLLKLHTAGIYYCMDILAAIDPDVKGEEPRERLKKYVNSLDRRCRRLLRLERGMQD